MTPPSPNALVSSDMTRKTNSALRKKFVKEAIHRLIGKIIADSVIFSQQIYVA